MSSRIARTLAGALMASIVATSFTPAIAGDGDRAKRDVYIEKYYTINKDRPGRDEWHKNRAKWTDKEYHAWYRAHHADSDDAATLGLFGLAAGALVGAAAGAAADDDDDGDTTVIVE